MLAGNICTHGMPTYQQMIKTKPPQGIAAKLEQLREEHRDLDIAIGRLAEDIHTNELQLKRLKKRKLQIKDYITKLESLQIPDLNA